MNIKPEFEQIKETKLKDVSTIGELVSLLKRHRYWDNEDPMSKCVRIASQGFVWNNDIKEAIKKLKKSFHLGIAYFAENIEDHIDNEMGDALVALDESEDKK